jgi:HTH-type transcriptional regulator/antitoxin HigA
MTAISEKQYNFALKRIEELLPITDDASRNDPLAIELSLMSDIVIEYEKEHFPIEKPSVAEVISDALTEKNMTQKQLAIELGLSPSRISDFVAGKSEPSLRVAGEICRILSISPATMMRL